MRFQLRFCARLLALAIVLGSLSSLTASAQSRLNDRDVETLMNNLRQDISQFRNPYEAALKKSSFRKTSKEKDARDLGKRLEDEAKNMLKVFQKKHQADQPLSAVNLVAQQIDPIVRQLDPQSSAVPAWSRVQSDLTALGSAFGVIGATSPQPPSTNVSCSQSVGDRRAATLVRQCQAVSPATNSPCNAQNSCKTITDEIRRGCSMLTSNAPSFCAEYR